jgi:hypothetical protein
MSANHLHCVVRSARIEGSSVLLNCVPLYLCQADIALMPVVFPSTLSTCNMKMCVLILPAGLFFAGLH